MSPHSARGTFKDRKQLPDLSKSTNPKREYLNTLRRQQTVMDFVTVRQ